MRTLAHDEAEISVGRSAAGAVKVLLHFEQPIVLEKSIFPGISGHASGNIAFHSIFLDEPEEDLFQLSPTAFFQFVLLAKDPGIEVWNDTGSGFLATNGVFRIGQPPFDAHPIWNLVAGHSEGARSLTLLLRDANGVYPDSEPFQLSFTAPPQPGFRLTIIRPDAQSAKLTWPTNAVGGEIRSSPSPTGGPWQSLTNVPSVEGTNFALAVPLDEPQQFFRLAIDHAHPQ